MSWIKSIPSSIHAAWRNPSLNPFLPHFIEFSYRHVKPLQCGRPTAALWDISHGCILWLPKKETMYLPKPRNNIPSSFDRPVLVLDVKVEDPENASVTFLFLITHNKASALQGSKLWTANTDATMYAIKTFDETAPDFQRKTALYLEGTPRPTAYEKPHSFVNIRKQYSIPWKYLKCYDDHPDAFHYRLDKESFLTLAKKVPDFEFSPESWIPTEALWPTFYKQHIKHNFTLGSQGAKVKFAMEEARRVVRAHATEELDFSSFRPRKRNINLDESPRTKYDM